MRRIGTYHVYQNIALQSISRLPTTPRTTQEPRKENMEDQSTPGYRAPDYIPYSYDFQNNAQRPRDEFNIYSESYCAPPRSSSYNPRSRSRSGFSHDAEDRNPPSGYQYFTANTTYFSQSSSPPSYTFYSSPDSYPTNSSYSFHPRALPSIAYTPLPASKRPVTPSPQGIKPATDLYTVLGLNRSATTADIKKAHRAMSLKWHPDRCLGQDKKKVTEKMAEINQANDVLRDTEKREFYDRWGMLPSEL